MIFWTLATIFGIYIFIYGWARSEGVFWGERVYDDFWKPIGYTIRPACDCSLVVLRFNNSIDQHNAHVKQLESKKDMSRTLWPYFKWVANVELWMRNLFYDPTEASYEKRDK